MLLSWFTRRRRRRILAEAMPAAWRDVLESEVGHYRLLSATQQGRLRDAAQIMLAEMSWEGCRGFELTDRRRVIIAGLASILILGLPDYYFDNVQSILVYPDEFVVQEDQPLGGGVVLHGESERLGEAHAHGPVILAWPDVEEAAAEPGQGENLVFHEFAHQLDMLNGAFDGTPNLSDDVLAHRWAELMNQEYQRLERSARRRRRTVLDPYGATNPAEFFAVTTEAFFDAPRALQHERPELYALLRAYYCQDPAGWPWDPASYNGGMESE